jgi:hypothetical protein
VGVHARDRQGPPQAERIRSLIVTTSDTFTVDIKRMCIILKISDIILILIFKMSELILIRILKMSAPNPISSSQNE